MARPAPPPSRRPWRIAFPAGLAVLAVGAVALAAASARPRRDLPEAAAALVDVRSALEHASSFRFAVHEELDHLDEPGKPLVTSLDGTWSGDQSHVRIDGFLGVSETVVDGDTAYSRSATSAGDLAGEVWTRTGPEDFHDDGLASDLKRHGLPSDDKSFNDQLAVEAAAWIYLGGPDVSIGVMSRATGSYVGIPASILGGFGGEPTGFLDAITELGEPTFVHEADGITKLVATVRAPDDLVAAFGRPIPDGTVLIEFGPDGRPTELGVLIEHEQVQSRTEVAFSHWNQPVDIPVPSGDDVDTTPWLDEEGLRGLTDPVLVAPTALPEGWRLDLWAEEDLEDAGPGLCAAVHLDWFAPDAGDARDARDDRSTDRGDPGSFDTFQIQVDCALDEDPTPFRPGGPGGLASRTDPDLPGQVEVLVGDTAVSVESNLPNAERDALIATLAPADVETLIAAASERPPGW